MKLSKTMVAVAGTALLAIAGCKYDDAAAGDDSLSTKGKAGGMDVDTVESIVDESGLPATEVPFDKDPNYMLCDDVEFEPVYFGFDASNLASAELAKIEAVAQHLKENAGRVAIIEGHCDERGSNDYNLSLGGLRALSIRDYMVTLGIDGNRIQTKSFGEEKPAVTGSGESVWARNRRGEFAIYKHK